MKVKLQTLIQKKIEIANKAIKYLQEGNNKKAKFYFELEQGYIISICELIKV